MSFYESADQLYHTLETLFARVREENPDAGEAILAGRLITRMRIIQPAAEVTMNARRRPLHITYGPSSLRPDVEVEMLGDTLHRILLDELSMKKAAATGLLKVRGPAWKTFALADLFHESQALYPQVLADPSLPNPAPIE